MEDLNNLKKWLNPLLYERGLSIKALSEQSGVSLSAIYAWLCDRNRPDRDKMRQIVNALSSIPVRRNGTAQLVQIELEEALRQYTVRPRGRPAEDEPEQGS